MPVLPQIRIGPLTLSRLLLGGNSFSGFSHQGPEADRAMRAWFTGERIKSVLADAERRGITGFCGRADNHVMRLLEEYRAAGGRIQWLAQSAPERASIADNARQAAQYGAKAFYVHGGVADRLYRAGELASLKPALAAIRELGLAPGLAGHNPATHREAAALGLDLEFHLVCFYHPASRMGKSGEKVDEGRYHPDDREAAAALVRELERPCIAYKVLAAGRNDPREALPYAFKAIKPGDAVLVGVYPRENPGQLAENIALIP